MMKHFNLRSVACVIFMFALVLICVSGNVYAASDDPGADRLSGRNIPEEFYGEPSNPFSRISRFGAFTSACPFTNETYTHQDAFVNRPISHGMDVSQWQKDIDWAAAKAAGIEFAFVRVGYRGYGDAGTLNESTKDIYFDQNMKNANAAGIPVGIYVFSQAITPAEAVEEANYILQHIGSYRISMPLIMDYEYASDSNSGGRLKKAKLSKDAATEVCMAFCSTIAAAGYTPMVYANKSMLTNQLNAKTITDNGYRIWLAHYTKNTDYTGEFDFWQYSSQGKVNGISGNVDMNFYYAKEGDNFELIGIPLGSTVISPVANQAYTGQKITPAVTLTYEGIPLTENTDYTLKYKDNKNLGTASIIINGKGRFGGSITVKFNIVPKRPSNIKAKKRTDNYITLKWPKIGTATGYQIYRATSPNGTYKKIKQFSKNSTITYKNTGLTGGQRYYYKIRTFIKSNGKTYFSDYSPVAAIDTPLGYHRYAEAKSGAVIYASESTSDTVIATPAPGAKMTVSYSTVDNNGTTWYCVSYQAEGQTFTGMVKKSKVTVTMNGKVAKTNIVNVRKSASTSSKKLTSLKKNKKVTVLKTKTKKGVTWYQVTFKKSGKTYKGWISAPYLKLT